MRSADELGDHIVCQGGTFYNDAVLRAFEKIAGVNVVRPNIAGLMGAYGAALIAEKNYQAGDRTSLLSVKEMANLSFDKEYMHCGGCANNCELTLTIFNDGRKFVTGNRCERGEARALHLHGQHPRNNGKVNLVERKYKELFKYRPLRGKPAKNVHGHIAALIANRHVDWIFYPAVVYELQEKKAANNHFNCPIVQSYPEVIRNNVDEIRNGQVDFRDHFLNLADHQSTAANLYECFKDLGVTKQEVWTALEAGYQELAAFHQKVRNWGEDTLVMLKQKGEHGIVLAGRPYHLDPMINHGISQMIAAAGFHVLTEDSIAHLGDVRGLRVVNQWSYHSRLYAAARIAAKTPELEFVQLNSFGCGLDAIDTDQVEEIMNQYNRLYTCLKIDEGDNLGSIRIRIRFLKAAIKERTEKQVRPEKLYDNPAPVKFTKEMKRQKYTLLLPMLSPIHQHKLVDVALRASGYNVVNLPIQDRRSVDVGTRFVNNDACYPAIISIGQMVEALQSGKYDLDHTAVMMSQTGGGCRATNYVPLIRKALKDAGFGQVPVVSISLGNQGVETTPGFTFTLPLVKRVSIAFLYGDLFERLVYHTRPYEVEKGQVNALYEDWLNRVRPNVENGSFKEFKRNVAAIVHDFDTVP